MIGLLDYDLLTSTNTKMLIPNLEIMKLATYYQAEEKRFCRLLSLQDTELSSYEKIYFFSETAASPEIPVPFLRAKNVIYGGTAFTNGIYVPFENELIDYTPARATIYKEFLKQKYQDGVKALTISHVLDDNYYRMYAGEEQLPIPAIRPNKRVFLYDRDIFHGEWEKIIERIVSRKPSSIIPIHPIICHTLTQYFTLRNQTKIARSQDLILDIDVPLAEVDYMLKKYKTMFLADITPSTSIYFPMGGSYPTDFQYFKDFIYKLNLLYAFWSKDIPIKVKYQKPSLGYTDPLANLTQIIETWTGGETKFTRTLDERIRTRIAKDLSKAMIEEKLLLFKFHPEAKTLFDQNYTKLKEGGLWRL